MSVLLTFISYLCQITLTLAVALIIPIGILFLLRNQSNHRQLFTFLGSFLICLSLQICSMIYLMEKPFVICPKELRPLVTEQMKSDAVTYNRGIYSSRIPIVPVAIEILDVTETSVIVKTHYMFFGNTKMEISNGMPSLIHALR